MQCDLAQEQLSDYIEETLTPAMRHVFEQHLATCDPCSADVRQLREVYLLLDGGLPMVETPPGFRANILNAICEQPAPTSVWQRVLGVFAPSAQAGRSGRAPLSAWGSAALACVVVGVGGVWLNRHSQPNPNLPNVAVSSLVPWQSVPVAVQNSEGILQGVRSYAAGDGKMYHVFGLHLPAGMGTTSASAYVVQNPAALTDSTLLGDSDKAPTAWTGSVEPNTSVQVPVTLTANVPDDMSMMTMVTWTDSQGSHKELCILPLSKATASDSIAVGEPMYQALQTIAVKYQQPIIVNDDAVNLLNTPVTQAPDASDKTINDSLADVVIPDQMTFQQQTDGAYVVDAS